MRAVWGTDSGYYTSLNIAACNAAAAGSAFSCRGRFSPMCMSRAMRAFAQNENTVRERDRFNDIVRDEDRREAMPLPNAFSELVHLHARQGIERAVRLIEKQNAGLAHQRARKGDALPLPSGQDGRPVVFTALQTHIGKSCTRRFPPSRLTRDSYVAEHRLPGEKPGVLEEKAHIPLQSVHRSAINRDLAGSGLVEPGDEAHQCSLAAAGAANDGNELACGNMKIDPLQNLPSAERLGDAAKGQGNTLDALGGFGRLDGRVKPGEWCAPVLQSDAPLSGPLKCKRAKAHVQTFCKG